MPAALRSTANPRGRAPAARSRALRPSAASSGFFSSISVIDNLLLLFLGLLAEELLLCLRWRKNERVSGQSHRAPGEDANWNVAPLSRNRKGAHAAPFAKRKNKRRKRKRR
jgi:hypothetical protein